MEMRQIECFLACHEHHSFTAAARELSLVQSAVSTSVAKLEHELGVRLFDRTPRALELTEAGRAIVEPARSIVRARREIVDAIDATRGQVRGEVVIGNLMSVYSVDLAAVIADMHERHPGVTVQMRQSTAGIAGNIAGVRDGTLDIALVAGMAEDLRGLTLHPISEETLVLCVAPDHPLAHHRFHAADLTDARFIDFPPGWGIRRIVDTRFPRRRPVIEVADQIFALELVAKNFGVAVVPRSVAERAPGIVFAEHAGESIPWVLSIGYDTRRTPSNAARTVIEVLRETNRR
ncbi:LysR family transcriptional regulator [Nocardia tenerifensis]|uniref:LysR family transcriptional regulator n=1 Tax=Nocardia tenerifensis TaxID=228006 RepID=A0A318K3A1_9NOCA|nr:LysR family transcriptional regulator [Nocardia tenerifensis]PXX62291.1 LysR family transcriptional regulator [Nocardia tenerifensis]